MNAIQRAEHAINIILRDLEIETHALIESIAIINYDITQVKDDCPQIMRGVRIALRYQPGSRWTV